MNARLPVHPWWGRGSCPSGGSPGPDGQWWTDWTGLTGTWCRPWAHSHDISRGSLDRSPGHYKRWVNKINILHVFYMFKKLFLTKKKSTSVLKMASEGMQKT